MTSYDLGPTAGARLLGRQAVAVAQQHAADLPDRLRVPEVHLGEGGDDRRELRGSEARGARGCEERRGQLLGSTVSLRRSLNT